MIPNSVPWPMARRLERRKKATTVIGRIDLLIEQADFLVNMDSQIIQILKAMLEIIYIFDNLNNAEKFYKITTLRKELPFRSSLPGNNCSEKRQGSKPGAWDGVGKQFVNRLAKIVG